MKRFLLFEEFAASAPVDIGDLCHNLRDACYLAEAAPKSSMDTWTYLHRSPRKNRASIDRIGLQPSTNKVLTRGLYTTPEQWDSPVMQSIGEDTYEVHLKRGSKVLWTDSDRPMDFVLGRFESPFKAEWELIVKGLVHDPNKLNGDPWFEWKEKFSRKVEEYLAKHGYSAIQEGGRSSSLTQGLSRGWCDVRSLPGLCPLAGFFRVVDPGGERVPTVGVPDPHAVFQAVRVHATRLH